VNSEQFSVNSEPRTTIGLVTCVGWMEMTPDEQALMAALAELGIESTAVAWDDSSVDWGAFDGLLIRTIWNYYEQPDAFRAWLDVVEQAGVPLWNSAQIVRLNMEKTYLRDLAQQGVAIVPTVWLEQGEVPVLANILSEQGWQEAVVKPVISISAMDTWVTPSTGSVTLAADQARFEKLLAKQAMMVQQRMSIEQGEWSIIFLGGEYSHAVLKRPQDGDFRVQEEYGGTSTLMSPPGTLIEQARHALENASTGSAQAVPDILYARVDGLDVNGRFVLMELELIEPYLFLEMAEGAVARFAQKLKQTVNRQLARMTNNE
jgi:glutathione synthase/RimK-type ligase-like ATP-grasp enzyme